MIRPRRFVYNAAADCIEEVPSEHVEPIAPIFGELHDRARQEYNGNREGKADTLRQATLERAERREFAHTKYGDERRWRE